MYYQGESNVPGAPGNLMAQGIPVGQDPRLPKAQLAPGTAPMGNAGFFYGPQLGQGVPPGYQNKTVS